MANEWLLLLEIPLLAGLIAVATQAGFFVPLPMDAVRKILKLAGVKKNDVIYDLGSGDGRVVIAAAKEHGIRAVGIERSPILYWLSKWNVRKHGVEDKVRIVRADMFSKDLSRASVVVAYLTPRLNEKLKLKLKRELKKGARVVSASHVFKGWKEAGKVKTGHFHSYLYVVD